MSNEIIPYPSLTQADKEGIPDFRVPEGIDERALKMLGCNCKDVRIICGGRGRDASHTIGKGLEGQDKSGRGEGGQWMHLRRDITGYCGQTCLRPEERWQNFPTISPVHRGNDGLPFDVDNLTIPFAKWRNESIKAYGNAIVPQVMYRIFQCIETLTLF